MSINTQSQSDESSSKITNGPNENIISSSNLDATEIIINKFQTQLFIQNETYPLLETSTIIENNGKEITNGTLNFEQNSNATTNSSIDGTTTDFKELDSTITKSYFVYAALNLEKIYSEILHETLHNVGCSTSLDVSTEILYTYAQQVFKISTEKHNQLLEEAENREAPEIILNVEVVKAKDLVAKDANGFSDPFVTLYLHNNSTQRFNTSVKSTTLRPVWQEHFALPIPDVNAEDEALCLEMWDFDSAETVKEKIGKIYDVKGIKGVRKLIKEIAITAATGQHGNELIGIVKIPLKTIPISGVTMWYSLEKKNKHTTQGVLKLRISFGSEKNKQAALQEHRQLLQIVLLYELETSQVAPYWWCGTFSPPAEFILSQNAVHSGLETNQIALIQYYVYTLIHQDHPLNFALFATLLEKLLKNWQNVINDGESSKEETQTECNRLFSDATKRLLPSCLLSIRKIPDTISKEDTTSVSASVQRLSDVLSILQRISNCDYFDGKFNSNIQEELKETVIQRAREYFNYYKYFTVNTLLCECSSVGYVLSILKQIATDLKTAQQFYDAIFAQQFPSFHYSTLLFDYYQAEVCTIINDNMETVWSVHLKRLPLVVNGDSTVHDINSIEENIEAILKQGTELFQIYLELQKLSKTYAISFETDLPISTYHKWFRNCVSHWLDIAAFKAIQRIGKAIEIDPFMPLTSTVKYSSSAVDTVTVLHQIHTFWCQLQWPEIEDEYTFMAKVIDDICKCCIYYSEQIATKIDKTIMHNEKLRANLMVTTSQDKFNISVEWCMAINNIQYVSKALKPFVQEKIGVDEIIQRMQQLYTPLEANRCQQTVNNVLENAMDTLENVISYTMEKVIATMVPSMRRLLLQGAEIITQENNCVDRLMLYVDTNLHILHNHLDENNFNRILLIVWEALESTLDEILTSNKEKRRPPSFFANLHQTLNLMMGSFKLPEHLLSSSNDSNINYKWENGLKNIKNMLLLHGLETNDVIYQIYSDLHKYSVDTNDSIYGELCVKLQFKPSTNNLIINVMSGRKLKPMDLNGNCDPFVNIYLLPESKFPSAHKLKTQTQSKTLYPLFDEVFNIDLNLEDNTTNDGLIIFVVKDSDLMGYKTEFIGEAYVYLKDVISADIDIKDVAPTYLQLQKPAQLEHIQAAVQVLEYRQGDKQAKKFLKKLKQKMN